MKRLLTFTVLLFLLLTACTTQDAAPAALQFPRSAVVLQNMQFCILFTAR